MLLAQLSRLGKVHTTNFDMPSPDDIKGNILTYPVKYCFNYFIFLTEIK